MLNRIVVSSKEEERYGYRFSSFQGIKGKKKRLSIKGKRSGINLYRFLFNCEILLSRERIRERIVKEEKPIYEGDPTNT